MTLCHFKRRIIKSQDNFAEFTVLNLERNRGAYKEDYPWVRARHNPVYIFNTPAFGFIDLRNLVGYPYDYDRDIYAYL